MSAGGREKLSAALWPVVHLVGIFARGQMMAPVCNAALYHGRGVAK